MLIANKFYPITEIYFRDNKPVDLRPGEYVVHANEPIITAIHIFKWSPKSFIIIETGTGQIIKFPSTALVEGAVYYLKINKLIEAGPNKNETVVMGLSSN